MTTIDQARTRMVQLLLHHGKILSDPDIRWCAYLCEDDKTVQVWAEFAGQTLTASFELLPGQQFDRYGLEDEFMRRACSCG
jgi:hypothetical protein